MAKAMQLPLPGLDMDDAPDAGACWTVRPTACCTASNAVGRSELRRLERDLRRLIEAGKMRRWTPGQMEFALQLLAEVREYLG